MNVQVLGAHNVESQNSKFVSLLIDDVLAIDAGGLTSSLSFEAQRRLKAILLTHQHYDHIRDIPAIGMNLFLQKMTVNIYSIPSVYDALTAHLLNGSLYPNFFEEPNDNPTLKFTVIEPLKPVQIDGYSILAMPVTHTTPAVGYQVTSPDGKKVFYSGDAGPGLAECWQHISPQLLITEVSGPDRYKDWAAHVGHLTASLLKRELASFQELKGYLPEVVLVHMTPLFEKEIEVEVAAVAAALNSSITLAHEGMKLNL